MNKVVMLGRLTKDPEVRYNNNQTAIASFSLAVDRKFAKENEPQADFFNVTAFGKLGEFVQKYLTKGTKIVLSGRIENNNYTDRNGQKVYAIRIVAEEIDFAESKQSQSAPEPYAAQQYTPQAEAPVSSQGFVSSQPEYEQQSFMAVPDGVDDSQLPFN